MEPHPDLIYKRNETTMTCQFRQELVAVAFLMPDGRWELSAIDREASLFTSRAEVVLALKEWAREYAWARTTIH